MLTFVTLVCKSLVVNVLEGEQSEGGRMLEKAVSYFFE